MADTSATGIDIALVQAANQDQIQIITYILRSFRGCNKICF